jgi:hypothetical protein
MTRHCVVGVPVVVWFGGVAMWRGPGDVLAVAVGVVRVVVPSTSKSTLMF